MPTLDKVFRIDITPEQFLMQCSQSELIEVQMLLDSHYYQSKMNGVSGMMVTSESLTSQCEKVAKALSNLNFPTNL